MSLPAFSAKPATFVTMVRAALEAASGVRPWASASFSPFEARSAPRRFVSSQSFPALILHRICGVAHQPVLALADRQRRCDRRADRNPDSSEHKRLPGEEIRQGFLCTSDLPAAPLSGSLDCDLPPRSLLSFDHEAVACEAASPTISPVRLTALPMLSAALLMAPVA